MRSLLILLFIFSFELFASENPPSLDEYRSARALAPLIGTYLFTNALQEDDFAILTLKDHQLTFWTPSGNTPTRDFVTDIRDAGKRIVHEGRWSGDPYKEIITSSLENYVASRREDRVARYWRSVTESSLTLNETTLITTFKRTYYRRKFYLFGPWVEDETSEKSRLNTIHRVSHYLKVSNGHESIQGFIKRVSARPSVYYRLKGSTSARDVRGAIAAGQFEVVTDASLQREFRDSHPPSAKIIPLKRKCSDEME